MTRAVASTTSGATLFSSSLIVATWALPEYTSGAVSQPAAVGMSARSRSTPMTSP